MPGMRPSVGCPIHVIASSSPVMGKPHTSSQPCMMPIWPCWVREMSAARSLMSLLLQREVAKTTHAWLVTLRKQLSKVEADTEEAYHTRRRLVELLVAGIRVGRKGDGSPKIEITYRFGPPSVAAGEREEEMFVGSAQNTLS
jgi:hypothetical protein